ncbi:DUF4932 domain-containing protein [Spirosoma flavum]|uniref:DUF4932 domain-containing protein n=1 Tax=Spirosoma flavum TaxID=2048557 RepID=A0ABW6AK16_9BACT
MKITLTLLLIFSSISNALAQSNPIPTIRTTSNRLVMYIGNERGNFNGVNSLPTSFSYSFGLEQEVLPFTLVSEKDSISMTLQYGTTTICQIIREAQSDTVTCFFTSRKLVKAAIFNDAYKKANKGKTSIEVPEVYELVNVIFALTNYGKTPAIYKETDYYPAVMSHFLPYKKHLAVRTIDSLLSKSEDNYPNLKMDSYAYTFEGDKIVNGGIYDRVSWGETNQLTPYIPLLEQFTKQSNFRSFYKKNTPYYKSLVEDFRRNVDVATMKAWLEKQFPTTHYSAVKVLFSPLVGWNQSANQFEDNGFTEAQMHINFPFINTTSKKQPLDITKGQRMTIAFTELNHSYLNPEAEKHTQGIAIAFKNLANWTIPNKPAANYSNDLSCFEEYMNYALVTLLYYDLFEKKIAEILRANIEKGMVDNRGFRRFKEFDQELLQLYKNRKPGQTVADLYPAIIDWSAKQ